MSDRLWSPAMRKWVSDLERHGKRLSLTVDRRRTVGGGIPYNLYGRITDAGNIRSVDNANTVRVTDDAPL